MLPTNFLGAVGVPVDPDVEPPAAPPVAPVVPGLLELPPVGALVLAVAPPVAGRVQLKVIPPVLAGPDVDAPPVALVVLAGLPPVGARPPVGAAPPVGATTAPPVAFEDALLEAPPVGAALLDAPPVDPLTLEVLPVACAPPTCSTSSGIFTLSDALQPTPAMTNETASVGQLRRKVLPNTATALPGVLIGLCMMKR